MEMHFPDPCSDWKHIRTPVHLSVCGFKPYHSLHLICPRWLKKHDIYRQVLSALLHWSMQVTQHTYTHNCPSLTHYSLYSLFIHKTCTFSDLTYSREEEETEENKQEDERRKLIKPLLWGQQHTQLTCTIKTKPHQLRKTVNYGNLCSKDNWRWPNIYRSLNKICLLL